MRFVGTLCGYVVAATLLVSPLANAADMTKTLRVAFSTGENGFDPQAAYDSFSFYVIGGIFDPLYVYDYFARPVRMIPNTAAALPEVTDQGRTYTIKVARTRSESARASASRRTRRSRASRASSSPRITSTA